MDTTFKFFTYDKHTDWWLSNKMGRSTSIASNTWTDPTSQKTRVLILSNSINNTLWQMYLDPINPTQIDFEFGTSKLADYDGGQLYVTNKYAFQLASKSKKPWGSALFVWEFKNDELPKSVNPKFILPLDDNSLLPFNLEKQKGNLNSEKRMFKKKGVETIDVAGIAQNFLFGMSDED